MAESEGSGHNFNVLIETGNYSIAIQSCNHVTRTGLPVYAVQL